MYVYAVWVFANSPQKKKVENSKFDEMRGLFLKFNEQERDQIHVLKYFSHAKIENMSNSSSNWLGSSRLAFLHRHVFLILPPPPILF